MAIRRYMAIILFSGVSSVQKFHILRVAPAVLVMYLGRIRYHQNVWRWYMNNIDIFVHGTWRMTNIPSNMDCQNVKWFESIECMFGTHWAFLRRSVSSKFSIENDSNLLNVHFRTSLISAVSSASHSLEAISQFHSLHLLRIVGIEYAFLSFLFDVFSPFYYCEHFIFIVTVGYNFVDSILAPIGCSTKCFVASRAKMVGTQIHIKKNQQTLTD